MKLKLDIESDLNQVLTPFMQTDAAIDKTSASAKEFGKISSSAFKTTTAEVDKFNKEIVEGGKEVDELGKKTKVIPAAANRLKELKKEIKDLTSQAIALKQSGDLVGAEKAAKQAGHLKDELKDVQDLVKSVSGNARENLAGAFGKATQVAAMGFEGVLSAQNLVGVKNEEFEKQLLKLQSIQSIARIAGEFGDVGDRLKEIKLGLSPVISLYTNANNALKNFSLSGKLNFKSLKEGASGLFGSLKDGIVGFVKSGVAGIKTLGTTLAANPLGIILVVIAAVIGAMVLLKDKLKPIGEIFKALGEIIDAVGDAIKRLGQSLGIVASEFEEGLQKQIDGTKDVVAAIGDRYDFEIAKAAAAGKETERIEIEKVRAQAKAIQQQIGNLYALSKIQGSLNEEQRKQFEELMNERKKLVQEAVVLTIKAGHDEAKKKEEEDKKARDEAKKQSDELKKLRKDLNDALLDLDKRVEKAELDRLNGKEKVLKQKEITEAELKILRESIEAKGKLTDKHFKFTLEQEGEFAKLQLALEYDTAQQLLQIEVNKANELANHHKKEIDDELAFVEMKQKIALAKVGSAKNETGLPEAEFEKMKERVIAQIKMQAAKDSLAIKKKQVQAETTAQITALEGEIKILEKKGDKESQLKAEQAAESIQAIKKRAQLEMDLLNATTEEEIKNLQDQINNIDKGLNKPKGFSLGKMLGLDDESMGKMQDAINTTIDSLKELSDTYFAFQQDALDKELKANDDRLSAREDNISDLKDRLAEEQALQEQGLANNVDRIKAEIDAQNAAKDADLAKDKQIKAEKKKLAKQQLIIDTALQASQLILAIAQLFANGSSFWVGPVPVGLIVAGLAATAMTASFISGKKKAFDAVNSDAGFKKGGYTGDVSVDEEVGPVHGQEFVHTAGDTKKYRNLFEGIHSKRKPLIHKGLLELLEGTGVTLSNTQDRELPNRISNKKDAYRQASFNAYLKSDNKGVEQRIDKVEASIQTLIKQQQNKTTVLPNGNIIKEFGNVTRTIKK